MAQDPLTPPSLFYIAPKAAKLFRDDICPSSEPFQKLERISNIIEVSVFSFALRAHHIKVELRKRMHDTVAGTGAWLNSLLRGHLNYFAVSGNSPSL